MWVMFKRQIGDWKSGEVVELSDADARRQVEQYGTATYAQPPGQAPKAAPPAEKPKRKRRTAAFFTEEPKTEEGDE